MSGWKTKTAALLSILYGSLGIVFGLHDLSTGAQFIINGLGIIGIGHKIEKSSQN